jgi:hypothetical protein
VLDFLPLALPLTVTSVMLSANFKGVVGDAMLSVSAEVLTSAFTCT